MNKYEVWFNSKVEIGIGSLNSIGKLVEGKKIFVISYQSKLQENSILDRLKEILDDKSGGYEIYMGISADPDIECIDEGAKLCRSQIFDMVIGIGGGSVIDAAKCISMLKNNSGSIRDYQMGKRNIMLKGPALIAIPTTSGTGSEATKVAVVTNKEENIKKSLNHPYLMPDYAVIDPELTISLPGKFTYSTGIDALSHAIESYCSLNANYITEIYSLKAIKLIINNIEKASTNGNDLEARTNMAVGSYMAGVALNAGVGIAHILAQPLGAVLGISHGDACSIMLPAAIKVNYAYDPIKYADVAIAMGVNDEGLNKESIILKGLEKLDNIYKNLGITSRISQLFNINEISFNEIIESVKKSTMHVKTNPRPVTEELMYEILEMVK